MQILFAISVLSFCLLLWAAVAVTRHIRRSQTSGESPLDLGPAITDSDLPAFPETDRTKPIHRVRYASVNRIDREFTTPDASDPGFSDSRARNIAPGSSHTPR